MKCSCIQLITPKTVKKYNSAIDKCFTRFLVNEIFLHPIDKPKNS